MGTKGGGGGGGEEVKSRDKTTRVYTLEFGDLCLIPTGRGMAKCDPDHVQGFILITISIVLI